MSKVITIDLSEFTGEYTVDEARNILVLIKSKIRSVTGVNKPFTGYQREYIRANVNTYTDQEFGMMFSKSAVAIKGFRARQGILRANNGKFKNGNTPHNKKDLIGKDSEKC